MYTPSTMLLPALCLSALLAASAAPSVIHLEIDVLGGLLHDHDVDATVRGSNPRPPAFHHQRPDGVDNRTTSTLVAMAPKLEDCGDIWHAETSIRLAIEAAREYNTAALEYVTTRGTDSEQYQQWFGESDRTRHIVVLTRFSLVDSYELEEWTYRCHKSCPSTKETERAAAFVDEDKFGIVHLCPAWFELPEAFRGIVLIHEATHFEHSGIPGTRDHRHEVEDALWLAKHKPDEAVWNAANYDLFADSIRGGLWAVQDGMYGADEGKSRVRVAAQKVLA